MEILEGDEVQYWLTFEYFSNIWSKHCYSLEEARILEKNSEARIIQRYKITTNNEGKIDLKPINSLDDIK